MAVSPGRRLKPMASRRRVRFGGHVRWAVLIFSVAFGLRLAWVAFVNPDPLDGDVFTRGTYDSVFYYGSALDLAEGNGYQSPWTEEATTAFPPGYPLALAGVFSVFGSGLMAAKLFNVFLGAATAVLVYALGNAVWGRRVGVVAGLLMALFPSQIFFSTVLMAEALFITLSVALLLLLVIWAGGRAQIEYWQILALGALLGAMSLVRAEALMLAPAMVVLWKLRGTSWLRLMRHVPLLIAGMALLIAPWTARNYSEFDNFILLRGEGQEISRVLRVGLSPDYDDRYKYEWLNADVASWSDLRGYYRELPSELVFVGAAKVADLFGSDDPFHWIQGNYVEPPLSDGEVSFWSTVANSYYYVVGAAALAGAVWWLASRDRRLLIPLWFLGSWSMIHLLFVPTVRYHFPVIPVITLLAALVALRAWDMLTPGRAREQAADLDRPLAA